MEEVVGTYDADTGRHRARVFRMSGGSYRVEVERLIDAIDAGGDIRGKFWSTIRGLTSYTDYPTRAAELAQENLRCGQGGEA